MNSELTKLIEDYPLPSGWSIPEVFTHNLKYGKLHINLLGLISKKHTQNSLGSAGQRTSSPVPRAYFELLERVSLLEANSKKTTSWKLYNDRGEVHGSCKHEHIFPQSPTPNLWEFSKSNGVALGASLSDACQRARYETVERDLILRSWFGHSQPQVIDWPNKIELDDLSKIYNFHAYLFPYNRNKKQDIMVTGLFAFPIDEKHPIVFGFGAAPTIEASLQKAENEFDQRLGFLWGEEIPGESIEFSPSPHYHQDFYMRPKMKRNLHSWLSGKHPTIPFHPQKNYCYNSDFLYADITPTNLVGQLFVIKAISPLMPLTFGHGHPWIKKTLPQELIVHPIA